MFLFWGTELLCFYNDAYRPSLGKDGKHPSALGRPGHEVWPEIWSIIKPLIDQVLAGSEATWSEDQLIPIYRNGKIEDVYWTFSYSPVMDETGHPAGVFVTCTETTKKVNAFRILEESNQRFENLVAQTTAGIIVLIGDDAFVEVVNESYAKLIGRSHEELKGKNLWEIIPEAEASFRPIIDDVRISGKPKYLYSHPFLVFSEGKRIEGFLDLIYQPYKNNKGEITGVIVMCLDVTAQVVARKKVHETQADLNELANAMPQLVWIADGNGKVTYYNDRLAEFSGARKNGDGTWVWEGLLHPDDLQSTSLAWSKATETGATYATEHRIKMADGSHRWFLSRAFPQKDEFGNITKWFGTATDIHDQKTASEKIREHEEELRIALEGGDLGHYDYNPQTGKLKWSARAKQMFGLPSNMEVNYDTYLQGLHPDDKERSHTAVQEALKPSNNGVYENEYRTIGIQDGQLRWLRSKGKISFDENGNAIRFTGILQDNTKEKFAEDALRNSESKFKQLSDSGLMGIIFADIYGRILDVNDTIVKMLGYTKEEIIEGHIRWDKITPGEQMDRDWAAVDELKINGACTPYQKQYICKNGSRLDVIVGYSFIPNSTEKTICFVLDISEQKQTERALQESESRFRNLVRDASTAIVVLTGPNMKVEIVNEAYGRLIGLKPNDLLGKPLFSVVPEAEAHYLPLLMQVLMTGEPLHLTDSAYSVTTNGKVIEGFLNATYEPYRDTDRNIKGVMAILQDVTDSVKFRKALQESENRFRTMANAIPEIIWVADSEGKSEFFNKRWEEFSGQVFEPGTVAEVAERFLHPDDRQLVMNAFSKAIISGQPFEIEQRNLSASGQYRWFLNRATPFRNQQTGLIEKWFGIGVDIHERKAIEQSLKENEQRFKTLANSIPQLAWMTDSEGWIYWYNQRWYDYTGSTFEQMKGWGWQAVHHPDLVEGVTMRFKKAIQDGTSWEDTFLLKGKDGKFRWFLSRALPIRNEAGNIVQWFGTNTDISLQREVEEALRKSEAKFRTLTETLPQLVWVTDRDGKQEYVSKRWKEYSGIEPEGSETWQKIIHPDDLENVGQRWQDSLASGRLYKAEARLRNWQGEYRWHFVQGESIKAESGDIINWIGAFTDIHDQKTITEKLELLIADRTQELIKLNEMLATKNLLLSNAQHFLQTVLDTSVEAVASFDTDLRYTFLNKKVEDLLKKSKHEVIGKKVEEISPAILDSALYSDLKKALSGEIVFIPNRATLSDREVITETYLIPLRQREKITGVVSLSRDITKIIKLTDELQRSNQELLRSNEDLKQFAYISSHDLQEPLRKIQTFSAMVTDNISDLDYVRRYLSKIDYSAARMSSLIKDVLHYSQASAVIREHELVDLNHVFKNVLHDFELRIQEKKANIRCQPLPTLKGNKLQFHQLFSNLVSNSLKFSDEQPTITVEYNIVGGDRVNGVPESSDKAGNYHYIKFSDNGIGFNQEYSEQIFKLFNRLHNRKDYSGTGIGLALCRKIVENHEGLINATSSKGVGTTFHIYFPKKINKA